MIHLEKKNPITDTQISELKHERGHSVSIWEDASNEEILAFDDKHSQNDWIAYIAKYSSRSKGMQEEWRKDMIKVANIALAAVSSYDRQNGVKTVM